MANAIHHHETLRKKSEFDHLTLTVSHLGYKLTPYDGCSDREEEDWMRTIQVIESNLSLRRKQQNSQNRQLSQN